MNKGLAEWLVAQWTSRFSEIMLTMGDVQPQTHVAHIEESAVPEQLIWWEQPFDCAPDSPAWTGAPEESWTEIGKIVLAAAGVDPAPPSEIQSTYLEIVRQSMSSLAQDIGHRTSAAVACSKGEANPPSQPGAHCFCIHTEIPGKTVDLYVLISDGLCRFISASEESTTEEETRRPSHAAEEEEEDASPSIPLLASTTFELLLDVEMPVSVSFGRASLKLYDALNMITGSLVELDRFLADPVELLVNNCVIARGEVVVVDGNYGVRITEIVSQKERLQQSRRYMLP